VTVASMPCGHHVEPDAPIAGDAIFEELPAKEKYGRTLARLWIGREDAASVIIREGLALPYTGGAKPSFCQPRI
jgi:micrococcal nuclease